MAWETFNHLHALEQVSGVVRALQTFMMVLLAKIVSTINQKHSSRGVLRKRCS